MELLDLLRSFSPWNAQERWDQLQMLHFLESGENIFTRENKTAHLTASSWVVSPKRDQVLMVYHNLYDSWSWMGGHADGERDLLSVALRETKEECGLAQVTPVSPDIFSLEILTVDGHVKRGEYVPSHLHLNVTFLLEADPSLPIRIKPDENSGVAWFPVDAVSSRVSEPWMMKWIYSKLMQKVSGGK